MAEVAAVSPRIFPQSKGFEGVGNFLVPGGGGDDHLQCLVEGDEREFHRAMNSVVIKDNENNGTVRKANGADFNGIDAGRGATRPLEAREDIPNGQTRID
jgi:hypothetical protein